MRQTTYATIGAAISKASGHISAWLIFAMMFMVVTEVVTRYVLRSPLMIADELGGYTVVAVTIIGLAYTWRERGHIRIEVLTSRLPIKARNWLRLTTLILATAYVPLLIYASYDLWAVSRRLGLKSDSILLTPLQWPRLILLVGSVLLFVVLVTELIQAIKTLRTPGGKLDGV
ncbi:MAG: TRAP transporter small permease [Chloroflexi bacterium]|nr:TRAP transporter small permease [Chloroflexota bacterium]